MEDNAILHWQLLSLSSQLTSVQDSIFPSLCSFTSSASCPLDPLLLYSTYLCTVLQLLLESHQQPSIGCRYIADIPQLELHFAIFSDYFV